MGILVAQFSFSGIVYLAVKMPALTTTLLKQDCFCLFSFLFVAYLCR